MLTNSNLIGYDLNNENPLQDIKLTIIAAIITPSVIARKALVNLILKMLAAKEPVQAPVVGNGIATKRIRPINSYFSIRVVLRLVLSSSQLKNFEKKDRVLNFLVIGEKTKSRIGTGRIFPITEKRKTS